MVTLLNKKSKYNICKACEAIRMRKQCNRHVQTQTTPNVSRVNLKKSNSHYNSTACTKNLLCDLGFHSGSCVVGSNTSICSKCSKCYSRIEGTVIFFTSFSKSYILPNALKISLQQGQKFVLLFDNLVNN